MKEFKGFVGRGYAPSKLALYCMPREQSWKLLDDRKVSCMVSEKTWDHDRGYACVVSEGSLSTTGSLADARR